MDQSRELFLTQHIWIKGFSGNVSASQSVSSGSAYNFTRGTAASLIQQFLDQMYTIRQASTIALLCLYVPVFVLSMAGNVLVALTVVRHRELRQGKNLFLVNLAVADILVTAICIPIDVGQIIFRLWVYGDVMCKLTGYMQGVAVTCSILTLTALSVNRCMGINAPLRIRHVTSSWSTLPTLIMVWLLSAQCNVPMLFVRTVYTYTFPGFDTDIHYCIETWLSASHRRAYAVTMVVLTYVCPISVLTASYTVIGRTLCVSGLRRSSSGGSDTVLSSRRRLARMLVVLIVVFLVAWLPYNACSLSLDWYADYWDTKLLPFTLWLGHAHSAINPFLYCSLSRSFQCGMRNTLRYSSTKSHRRIPPRPQIPLIEVQDKAVNFPSQETEDGDVVEPADTGRTLEPDSHKPHESPDSTCASRWHRLAPVPTRKNRHHRRCPILDEAVCTSSCSKDEEHKVVLQVHQEDHWPRGPGKNRTNKSSPITPACPSASEDVQGSPNVSDEAQPCSTTPYMSAVSSLNGSFMSLKN